MKPIGRLMLNPERQTHDGGFEISGSKDMGVSAEDQFGGSL